VEQPRHGRAGRSRPRGGRDPGGLAGSAWIWRRATRGPKAAPAAAPNALALGLPAGALLCVRLESALSTAFPAFRVQQQGLATLLLYFVAAVVFYRLHAPKAPASATPARHPLLAFLASVATGLLVVVSILFLTCYVLVFR
jgi:hypothetical protein